ncbi:unnamed protein product [Musa hybrid cultivar]
MLLHTLTVGLLWPLLGILQSAYCNLRQQGDRKGLSKYFLFFICPCVTGKELHSLKLLSACYHLLFTRQTKRKRANYLFSIQILTPKKFSYENEIVIKRSAIVLYHLILNRYPIIYGGKEILSQSGTALRPSNLHLNQNRR